MVKLISKLNFRILAAVILVASIGLCCFICEQRSPTEAATQPLSRAAVSSASVSTKSTAILSSNDTNWAGYIVASDIQNPSPNVTSISASWTVPVVTVSSQDTFSAVWIGIGGFFDSTLIQTGTEQDSIQGQSQYSAWLELLPQNSITIDNLTVSPGDEMNASIELVDSNTDEWSIYIKDLTSNQEYTTSVFYASSQLSAEWIVERPEITSTRSRGTLANLADVGSVKFTNCQTTIGNQTGTISSFPSVVSVMYQTVQRATDLGVAQLAAVSELTNDGSSFTVETSPSAIPELPVPVLILLPLIGVGLLVPIIRKRGRSSQN